MTDPGSSSVSHPLMRWAWEWTKLLATVLLAFILVKAFIVEAFKIPTGSMEGTLLSGDFLLVNKLAYGASLPSALRQRSVPERGDVVVFLPPHDPSKNYVKRIVGVPGDTLEMREKVLHLNGAAVDEPYVRLMDPITDPADGRMAWQADHLVSGHAERHQYRPSRDNWGPLVVPTGALFALGDNRDNSEDSRYWGFVRLADVQGRPMVVYFSFERDPDDPFAWVRQVRWHRFGDRIR